MKIVIGVGNMFRRDDGAGPACASLVKAGANPEIKVLIRTGEAADLLECWKRDDEVYIIDAMKAGLAPGSVKRIDGRAGSFPVNDFKLSSHSFGVAEAVEIGRVLVRLPNKLVIYGIEAGEVGDGQGLTPEVEKAVSEVAIMVLGEMK
jgi:hydrogenase maturation protease